MRISDWSSDVCSSDLRRAGDQPLVEVRLEAQREGFEEAMRVQRLDIALKCPAESLGGGATAACGDAEGGHGGQDTSPCRPTHHCPITLRHHGHVPPRAKPDEDRPCARRL